jgi:hypothetical protein
MKKNSSFNRKIPKLAQVFGLLREQEEKEDTDAGDIFGDEPAGEDKEKKEEEPAGEDEEKTDDADGEKEDKAKKDSEGDTKIKISAEERAEVEDSIGDEVDGFLQDAEHKSRASAAIESEKEKRRNESLKRVYSHLIREAAASDIDLQVFASEVARLIKNYSTLLDIEVIILNRAVTYIKNYYGEDTAKTLKDILGKEYRISVPKGPLEKDEPEIPIAVGARASGGE